jgi:superfamily II DNA/RNA helicase
LTAVFNRPFHFGGYQETEQRYLAKYYLDMVTIRRRKQEVLPQLPPKIRQSFPVELELTAEDKKELNDIVAAYNDANNKTAWFAAVARARHLSGKIKANSTATSDVLKTIIEEKGSAVVFTHHKSVAEIISDNIAAMKYTVSVISGDVSPEERDRVVQAFQSKSIDVIVATIDTGGEGITLHRTDTVVFLEFDWVPAAMWQAEDRIHRDGQQAESCYIVYIPGVVDERGKGDSLEDQLSLKLLRLDTLIQEVLLKKLAIINDIHGENNILFPDENSVKEVVMASLPCPPRLGKDKGNHSEYVRRWRQSTGRTKHAREDWLRQHSTEQTKPWLAENISRATWFRKKIRLKTDVEVFHNSDGLYPND